MSSAANFGTDDETITDTKDELRSAIRARRTARSARLRSRAAEGIADRAMALLDSRGDDVRCVAAYASRPTEPGTGPLLESLAGRSLRVLLPVLGPGLARGWAEFAGVEDLAERAPGRPPEPSAESRGADALGEAAVILAPALGVDADGFRLGQGGGWYDRALRHRAADALVVAVLFDDEVRDTPLPREPHDVPVDAVLTPSEWWLVGR